MLRVSAAVVVAAAMLAAAPAAPAHEGNPNFRSEVRPLSPALRGIDVQVVNFDDSLQLTNRSGRTVVVEGYRGEPYLRFTADGKVAVNQRSPSYYLNDDRYADATVPADATPDAIPDWQTVNGTGQYTWHDHRIHWMARSQPPQVKDETRWTKIFSWRVPVKVGQRHAVIAGRLIWIGRAGGGFPLAAAVSLVVVVLAGGALVVVVQRRRRRRSGPVPAEEAW